MALILVTGAHGFIGKYLSRGLSAAGHTVCGLGHGIWPERESCSWGVSQWVNGDITPNNLRLIQMSMGTPDVIYHLAGGSSVGSAVANPREDFFRTVATTVELLDWLRLEAKNTGLVVVSSAAVYGSNHSGAISEDSRLRPFSPYGYHKRLMEELCRSYAETYGVRTSVARLFSVYGAGLRKQLLWDLCSRLATGDEAITLGGNGEELRDWTNIRDVVRALSMLMLTPTVDVPVYNVGTGIGTPVREIARQVMAYWAGPQASRLTLSFSGQSRPGDPFSLIADPSRLKATGFQCQIALDVGLAEYVSWFRRQMEAVF